MLAVLVYAPKHGVNEAVSRFPGQFNTIFLKSKVFFKWWVKWIK